MSANRLPVRPGERLNREKTVAFSFEGRRYEGFAGDTIASALAANDVWLLSRSFKYHRPRGILTMAGQDSNTLVQLPEEPNVMGDMAEIEPDMTVTGQNYRGSLGRDRGAWIEHVGAFMPVGFYYKAFYKPKGAWRWWEPVVRNMAGLGIVNQEITHGYYDKAYGFYDVAVAGGGPAGMAAALQAAGAGAEVVLIEENPALGGSLAYARFDAAGEEAGARLAELGGSIAAEANITVLTGATAQGWFTDNWLPVTRGNRMYKIRAREVVMATGSIEQPMVFRNNDLVGIMQGSAAQRLMHQFGVRPGRRAVVATANGDGYGVALDLAEAGVEVAAVVDLREAPPDCSRADAVRDSGIRVLPGHTVFEGRKGGRDGRVGGAVVARITGQGECRDRREVIDCDLVTMSTGYAPTAHLMCHAGGRMGYDSATAAFALRDCPDAILPAGSVAGAFHLDAALAEGRHVGWAASKRLGLDAGPEPDVPADRGAGEQNHPWPIFPHPKGKEFIDFDEDLQIKDIRNAVAEGFDHIQLLKRYSTVGMGPSQGRHAALTTARLCADATGEDIEVVGTSTVRPPFAGEKFGQLAGRAFEPVRHTAMHHRHLELGAQMMLAGLWLRSAYYGAPEEKERCIQEEATAVREGVGLIDVSTLGGLDVRGPDAAEFLNRMYTFSYLKQQVGRGRYVLMCDSSGSVVDDGVACRFHDHHFYVTATTGGVDRVYQQMLWYNAQWRLDVDVTNVSATFAGVNIAGPRSREVLSGLCPEVDLSAEGFPYMGVRMGVVAGIEARLLRVGFVGELGYEIHVPASQGEALWDAVMEAGAAAGIRPFGVEAQRLLRLEKGHIIIGQDTDGETTPYEADMAWAISRRKPFFVGERALRVQSARPPTRKLVGFTLPNADDPVPEECHLVIRGDDITGRVTSASYSPTLGRVVGLAYVAPDQAAPGTRFDIRVHGGRMIGGEVVPLPHYDPENERQEM